MEMINFKQRWDILYQTTDDVAETLVEAKQRNATYYRHICKKHGKVLFYTKDNSCPICCKVARDIRVTHNRVFNRSREIYNEIKQRAKKKNVLFLLTKEEFRTIYGTVHLCPVLHIPIVYDKIEGVMTDNSPSTDRLIPENGYTMDNINIISNRANRIKNNGTPTEHIQVAIWQLKQEGNTAEDILDIVTTALNSTNIVNAFIGD